MSVVFRRRNAISSHSLFVGSLPCLTALCFSNPFRHVVEELLNSIARCPFRSNPRTLLSSSQFGQDHTVKCPRAFSLKLCFNFESLICLSNGSLVSDNLFKNRFDG